MDQIRPVVLSGGIGSRLWPVSRRSLPKQFTTLLGGPTLFQQTLRRVQGPLFSDPIIVAAVDHRYVVSKQLAEEQVEGNIYLEPDGKNTAPAVIAASLIAKETHGDHLMLILPSDHYINSEEMFVDDVMRGVDAARNGSIVTFGVKPSRAETGYGYIEIADLETFQCQQSLGFNEKPPKTKAQEFFEGKRHLWNAGIFLFRYDVLLEAAKELQPDMLDNVGVAVSEKSKLMQFNHLSKTAWATVCSKSLDYAIIEKIANVHCVRLKAEWSDMGDWAAVERTKTKDKRGNVSTDSCTEVDCKNTLLWSHDDAVHIAGIGLQDIAVVASRDAVLVADANRLQDVRKVVEILTNEGISVGSQLPIDYRPWGWFESLTRLSTYQVKRLHVLPGGRLSYQSHSYRSEHWVVVSGQATICLEGENLKLNCNESIFIDVGKKHSLANETGDALIVIEVQSGSYLGEDDITRYGDMYDRMVERPSE